MQWLNSTGIAVSLFFILFIFGKKNKKRVDYLLILINLLMISFLALDIAVRTHLSPLLFFCQTITPYLLFPIYIFFAIDTVQEKYNSRWILYFIPVFFISIFLIIDLFVIHTYDTTALQKLYEAPPMGYHIMYKGNQILFLVALIWLIKKLDQHARNIKEQFSFIDPIQLSWLTQTSWAYLALTVVSILIFVISNFQWLPVNVHSAYSIVSLGVVFAVFYVSYHGIRQYTVAEYYGKKAAEENAFEALTRARAELPEKYKTSSLTAAEQVTIYQQLLQLFDNKKVFLEPKLQLPEVASIIAFLLFSLMAHAQNVSEKNRFSLVFGLNQPLVLKGFNVEGNYWMKKWVIDYSHGFNLHADGKATADEYERQKVNFKITHSLGLGVGYRFTKSFNLRFEPKLHKYETYYEGQDQSQAKSVIDFNTVTLGFGAYYCWIPFEKKEGFAKGITIVPSIRYWYKVSSSLPNDQHAYFNTLTNQNGVLKAPNIGAGNTPWILNVSVGYTF